MFKHNKRFFIKIETCLTVEKQINLNVKKTKSVLGLVPLLVKRANPYDLRRQGSGLEINYIFYLDKQVSTKPADSEMKVTVT